jgi:O-antigen/teichoic acid export membrane protein
VAILMPALRIGLLDARSLVLTSVGGSLSAIFLYIVRTRQGLGQSAAFRNSYLVQNVAYLLLGTGAAIATHSASWIMVSWCVAVGTSIGWSVPGYLRLAAGPEGLPTRLRTIMVDSLSAHAGTTGQQLLFRADVPILGLLASAHAVGLYSIAVPLAELPWQFSEAISLLTFGEGREALRGAKRVKRLRALTRMNFRFSIASTVTISAMAPLAIWLFLPRYVDAIPLIWLLAPGVVAQGHARILLSSIITRRSTRAAVLLGFLSALVAGIYVPAILLAGVAGAAAGSSVAYLLQTWIAILIFRSSTGLPSAAVRVLGGEV